MEPEKAENFEDLSEIGQTWNKVETTSKKSGLRDGIADGRESSFQEYFDIGFKEGFKNGYALGKYKGLLAAHSKKNCLEIVEYPLLQKTSRGGCEVCKNEELLKNDVSAIIKKQTDISHKNLQQLYSTFNKTFNCELPKS
ncbi:uncharacterized protein LOC108911498, partial [Anoplophora glabripennis]|uniref:uncharacterized protein LOC108911498 n=1 Tax=Anoplophora glabripennis TaxID=217634 RepID=UPI0008750CBF